MAAGDTIAALATPAGAGALAVVRVSGPAVPAIAEALLGRCPPPRVATFTPIRGAAGVIDEAVAIYFKAPASFTGEDSLELQVHGGRVVPRMVLDVVLAAGARLAEPGEFTRRACLNDKLDLLRAEAIADLINAASERAARSALASLRGALSGAVHQLRDQTTQARALVEATLDFPDEELPELAAAVARAVHDLQDAIHALIQRAAVGRRLSDGVRIALLGAPNVGKSSLMNALLEEDVAIVTDRPGTTRDLVRGEFLLGGQLFAIVDTAGLRSTDEAVERLGMERAQAVFDEVDLVLHVIAPDVADDPAVAASCARIAASGRPVVTVWNKRDLAAPPSDEAVLAIAARSGEGLAELRATLLDHAGAVPDGETEFSARERHVHALHRAAAALTRAEAHLADDARELIALELAEAAEALAALTGDVTTEDVLGRIFSTFCIGK